MASMERFSEGIVIPELHPTEKQYCALLIVIGDGKTLAEMQETKKSVSKITERICRCYNVTSARRGEVHSVLDPAYPFLITTAASHERDRILVETHEGATPELYSKLLGQSGKPPAFSRSLQFLPFELSSGMPGALPFVNPLGCFLWSCG